MGAATIGSALAEKRRELGLEKGRAAAKIGMSRTTYSSYEQDTQRPSADVFPALASFLEISIEELLTLYGATCVAALRTSLESVMSNLQSEIPDTESPDGTPLKTEVPDQPQSVDDVDDVEEFEEVEEVESVAVSPEQTEPIVVTAVTPETLEVPEIEEPLAHEDVPEKQQAPPDQETRVDDGDEVGAPNIELSHLLEEAPKPESSGKSSGHKKKKKKKHKKN